MTVVNTPNKLTVFRVILIPVFILFYMMERDWSLFVALFVYVIATITDQLDGMLARKNNQVTTFGKLMDPIADKMLIMSALICFVKYDRINLWVVVIILAREFIVTGIRMLAMGENNVIAASGWGKAKTVSQCVLTIGILVFQISELYLPEVFVPILNVATIVFEVVAVGLTIYSGWDYVWKNKGMLTFK